MVCSFCRILRAVSSPLKRLFSYCVVTWELLGNIHSDELEGYIISRCRESVQSARLQRFHWLARLKLRGSGSRFHHGYILHHVEPTAFFQRSNCLLYEGRGGVDVFERDGGRKVKVYKCRRKHHQSTAGAYRVDCHFW